VQSRPDACLDGAERLIEPRSGLHMREAGEERGFDRLPLARREASHGRTQRSALFSHLQHVAEIGRRLGRRIQIAVGTALLPVLEAQPVDRAGARLVS
jgi:hypothetical protein